MNKILFELRVATNIFKFDYIFQRKKKFRNSLYKNGLKLLFDKSINFEIYDVDFIFVDNTVSSQKKIDSEILDILPSNVLVQTIKRNNYGKKNYGAGDIDVWRYNKDIIQNYEYFFHYEPRIQVFNKNFIKDFLEYPCNYFSHDQTNYQFNTGYFGIRTVELIKFINSVDLDNMVINKISIEKMLYDYFVDKEYKEFKGKYGFRFDDYTNSFELY